MGRIALLALACALIAPQTAASQVADPAATPAAAELALRNVVRIEAGQVGAGFVVGRSGDVVWVATAGHVAFSDTAVIPPIAHPDIKVVRAQDPRRWSLAGPPRLAFGEDLAFLPVRMPLAEAGPDLWRERVLEADASEGDPVRIAASASAIGYGAWAGQITTTPGGLAAKIVEGSAQAGQSGAPVATQRGFVGMYLGAGLQVTPMSVIQKAAELEGIPWRLAPVSPRPIELRVCVTATGRGAQTLRLNTVGGIFSLDATGCTNAVSGPATLFATNPQVTCQPAQLNLPRQAQVNLTAECRVQLAGVWQSASQGYLNVQSAGQDRWTFEGVQLTEFGWIRGTLTRLPNDSVMVTGESEYGGPVTGTLTVEPRRLSGTLLVGGGSTALEVSR